MKIDLHHDLQIISLHQKRGLKHSEKALFLLLLNYIILDDSQRTPKHLKHILKSKSAPLYNFGQRNSNIKHAQLRMKCSKLNFHLFRLHVIDSPKCSCGYNSEDSEHFLLMCPLYDNERIELINTIIDLQSRFTLDTLLFGDDQLSFQENTSLFKAIHKYIEATGRLN